VSFELYHREKGWGPVFEKTVSAQTNKLKKVLITGLPETRAAEAASVVVRLSNKNASYSTPAPKAEILQKRPPCRELWPSKPGSNEKRKIAVPPALQKPMTTEEGGKKRSSLKTAPTKLSN